MCFHSKQSKKAQEVETRYNAKVEDAAAFLQTENINGFIHPSTPVITNKRPDLIQNFSWGLIPEWAKDSNFRKHTLNARRETLEEKPSFKEYTQNRCLIIANGFYEWKWINSKGTEKHKYLIGLKNEALYAYAGIYSQWRNKTNGELINSYSILTTEANDLVAKIHSKKRMPIILKKQDEASWLAGQNFKQFSHPYEVNLIAKNLDNRISLF